MPLSSLLVVIALLFPCSNAILNGLILTRHGGIILIENERLSLQIFQQFTARGLGCVTSVRLPLATFGNAFKGNALLVPFVLQDGTFTGCDNVVQLAV